MSQIKFSVIICTRNRPQKIFHCIQSILKNKFNDYEIVIVDQSNNFTTRDLINRLKHNKIKYYRLMNPKGLGHARNFGISKANADLVAFTDDDCLVALNWLSEIWKFMYKHKEVTGVFGQSLPYKPNLHKNGHCPSTNISNDPICVSSPYSEHARTIGLGNNMVFRKTQLRKNGGFKEWLGVGSIGKSAEEKELIYNLLKANYKLCYFPEIKIYHNRWLTPSENLLLHINYSQGFFTFYFYHLTRDKIMLNWFREDILEDIVPNLLLLIKRPIKNKDLIIRQIIAVFNGICIGTYISLNKKITNAFGI